MEKSEAEKLLSCKVKSKFEKILTRVGIWAVIIGAVAMSWAGVYFAATGDVTNSHEFFGLVVFIAFVVDFILLFLGFMISDGLTTMDDIYMGCATLLAMGTSAVLKVGLLCYRYVPLWLSIVVAVIVAILVAYASIWLWCEVEKGFVYIKKNVTKREGV